MTEHTCCSISWDNVDVYILHILNGPVTVFMLETDVLGVNACIVDTKKSKNMVTCHGSYSRFNGFGGFV